MGKTYHGVTEGAGHASVYVQYDDGSRRPLTHYVKHSPDGFSWGYAGSGCAELARCVLSDYLNLQPLPVHYGEIPEIDGIYQKLKREFFVSINPHACWTITSEQLAAWLVDHPPTTTCPKHREFPINDDGSCFLCQEEAAGYSEGIV